MTASINVWKEGNIRTKERHWESATRGTWFASELIIFHCIGLYHISHYHTQSQYSNMTLHDTEIMDTPQRRHKHLFEEHLFIWQLFPRLMQNTSVDSHRNHTRPAQYIPGDFHRTAHPVTMKDALRASFWTCTKMPALAWQDWQSTREEHCDPVQKKLRQACTTSRISP